MSSNGMRWMVLVLAGAAAMAACGGDDDGDTGADTGGTTDVGGQDGGGDTTTEVDTSEPDTTVPDTGDDDTAEPDSTDTDPGGCATDEDCDDGDACNGRELCDTAAGTCVTGEALACAASDPCHTAECDPEAGCVEALIDGDDDGFASTDLGECGTDCDDTTGAVNPNAEEVCDGIDNDCSPETRDPATRYIADCDNDGFVSREAEQQELCEEPSTPPETCASGTWEPFADLASDCCLLSADYYPGSEVWISEIPVAGEVLACEDFDSNCDGEETLEFSNLNVAADAPCAWDGTTCVGEVGWTGNRRPSCGFAGEFSNCTGRLGSATCNRVVSDRTVRCR